MVLSLWLIQHKLYASTANPQKFSEVKKLITMNRTKVTRQSSYGSLGLPSDLSCQYCMPSVTKALQSSAVPRKIKNSRGYLNREFIANLKKRAFTKK